ncbi:tetratricopeptide repeat protein [Nocardia sp. NPDC052278]|uniref:tetratricopeptide repeat protein n=1 Tax=unclassified Nocardia TaxID=2637762 RepID=UPI003676E53E
MSSEDAAIRGVDPTAALAATAVAVGAAVASEDSTSPIVAAAYRRLRRVITERYGSVGLRALEQSPGSVPARLSLSEDLEMAGAAGDAELVYAARAVHRAVRDENPDPAASIGVDLQRIEAANLRITDVYSPDISVHLEDSRFTENIEIRGITAGKSENGLSGDSTEFSPDALSKSKSKSNAPRVNVEDVKAGRDIVINYGESIDSTSAHLAELVELFGSDDLPKVADLDPYTLGATPSTFGNSDSHGRLDPYVSRFANQVDARLVTALSTTRLTILVGPSKAGKTRTLFEALRHAHPEASLIAPLPGKLRLLAMHPRIASTDDDAVVWLDDLDRFLISSDPISSALLDRMRSRPGRTRFVATLRSEARERLRANIGEIYRESRRIFERAVTIDLASTSDDSDEQSAAAHAYPGLKFGQYGLGELLAGANDLLQRYDDSRHSDPIAHSIIQVAIDWARVGRPDPIPEHTLAQLAEESLHSTRPEIVVSPDILRTKIKSLRMPPAGAGLASAISTTFLADGARGYRPFDYLVAADDGQNHGVRAVETSFWRKATHGADRDAFFSVGLTARQRGFPTEAQDILQSAAEAGHPEAMFNLATLLAKRGNDDKSASWFRKAAELGIRGAAYPLAVALHGQGNHIESIQWYIVAIENIDHRAIKNLDRFLDTFDPWKVDESGRYITRDTVDKLIMSMLDAHAEAGHTGAMIALYVFGASHTARDSVSWLRRAAEAGDDVAMVLLAEHLVRREGPVTDEAVRWTQRSADVGNSDAMYVLGTIFDEREDSIQAEKLYRAAIDAGNFRAITNLGALLHRKGDRASLEAAFRTAAYLGSTEGMARLGLVLSMRGENRDAEKWFRKAAEAGDVNAMCNLAEFLEKNGDKEESEYWHARTGAFNGDPDQTYAYAVLLEKRGETEESHRWYAQASARGVRAADAKAAVFWGDWLRTVLRA